MTIIAKRFLYIFAFFIFFIISPLLVLYAWGYRYDFAKQKVEITGILYIKSYPRGADIYVDNALVPYLTPTQITGLVPKLYDVKVTKAGMQPWEKHLLVKPQLATFAEDIVLFKSKPIAEAVDLSGKLIRMQGSPDGQSIALLKQISSAGNMEIQIIDTNNQRILMRKQLATTLAPYNILWSDNSRRATVYNEKQALIIIVDNPLNPITANAPANTKFLALDWNINDDNTLYALTNKGMYAFGLAKSVWQPISNQTVLGYIQRSNEVNLSVIATSSKAWLTPWPIAKDSWKIELGPTISSGYSGASGQEGLVIVQNNSGQAWLVNTATTTPAILKQWPDFISSRWSPQYNVLAVLHKNGVTLVHTIDELIDEINLPTDKLWSDLQWYPGGTHVYISSPALLEVAEIDPRGERNIYTLVNDLSYTGQFLATGNSKEIFISTSSVSASSTQSGVYQLTVQ